MTIKVTFDHKKHLCRWITCNHLILLVSCSYRSPLLRAERNRLGCKKAPQGRNLGTKRRSCHIFFTRVNTASSELRSALEFCDQSLSCKAQIVSLVPGMQMRWIVNSNSHEWLILHDFCADCSLTTSTLLPQNLWTSPPGFRASGYHCQKSTLMPLWWMKNLYINFWTTFKPVQENNRPCHSVQ